MITAIPPPIYNPGNITYAYKAQNVSIIEGKKITGNFSTWKQPVDYSGYRINPPLKGKIVVADGSPHEFVINSRILLNNQLDPTTNGIYVIQTSNWLRSIDMPIGDHAAGIITYSIQEHFHYFCNNLFGSDVVGINSLTYAIIDITSSNYNGGGEQDSIQFFKTGGLDGTSAFKFTTEDTFFQAKFYRLTLGPAGEIIGNNDITFNCDNDLTIITSETILNPSFSEPIYIQSGDSVQGTINFSGNEVRIIDSNLFITGNVTMTNTSGNRLSLGNILFTEGGIQTANSFTHTFNGIVVGPKSVVNLTIVNGTIEVLSIIFAQLGSTTSIIIPIIEVYDILNGSFVVCVINNNPTSSVSGNVTISYLVL
jgi:hypothetical protein